MSHDYELNGLLIYHSSVALAEKHVLTRLSRLAFPSTRDGSIPAVQTTPYLFEALPATALLAKAFPHLAPEILIIMKGISLSIAIPMPPQCTG
jgi:hypothetical protein